MEFIRKYIHVAKMVKPVLTQEASDYIAEEYTKLRSHDQVNNDLARVGIWELAENCYSSFNDFSETFYIQFILIVWFVPDDARHSTCPRDYDQVSHGPC